MKQRLVGAALAVSLLLPACAESPQKAVYTIRGGYDASFLAPAAHYAKLPPCAAGQTATVAEPCGDPKVVTALRKADASAKAALDAAENVVRNNPQLDAATFVNAAEQAVKAAVSILTTYGIK